MTQNPDENSAFFKGLDQSQRILATIGLVLSGVAFVAGISGLAYVAFNVLSTRPPTFGSQGEWLYGGLACLLVAGWGFSQAAKFLARFREAAAPAKDLQRRPRIQIGSEGLLIELPPLQAQNAAAKRSPGGFTWSFTSNPVPVKTFKLDEAQLAAAQAAAGSSADWDAVCRQANPEYATWGEFEQSLYRHAVQSVIEGRREGTRG